jgi:hypothetical protein
MRVKTIKLSQENTGISLCDFGLGIDFLIWHQSHRWQKRISWNSSKS